jgi:hypothetical protein
LFKWCINHSKIFFFVFENTSINGIFVHQLKDPSINHMQTFHHLNKNSLVLYAGGRALFPQAALILGPIPLATTLEVTTLKLWEALGSRPSPIHKALSEATTVIKFC